MRTVIEKPITEEELGMFVKPISYNNTTSFPYNELDDRSFEILLYMIFKEQIKSDKHNNIFDEVSLMQGVGEEGRDCSLYLNGKSVGLIQCKLKKARLGKPEVIKEMVKFFLYYHLNRDLISDIENFTYYFAVSTGFSGPAIKLLDDFNTKIFEEEDSNLEKLVAQVIDKYETFKDLKYQDVKSVLEEIFRVVKVKKIIPEDLDQYLSECETLIPRFFSVRMVIDAEELAKLRKEYEREKMRLPDVLEHIYNHINGLEHVASPEIKKKIIDKSEEVLGKLMDLGEEDFIKFIKAMKMPFLPSFADKARFSFERNLTLITDIVVKITLISLIHEDLQFTDEKGQALVFGNSEKISLVFTEGNEDYNYVILLLLKQLSKSSTDLSKIQVVVAGNSTPDRCVLGGAGAEINYDYIISEIFDVDSDSDKEMFTELTERFNFTYHCQQGLNFRTVSSYEDLQHILKMNFGGEEVG